VRTANLDVRLQIRNLSKATTEDDLMAVFAQAGEVLDVSIIRDRRSGESRGFGFVTMSAQSEADKAVSRLNEYSLNGLNLNVRLAQPRAGTDRT